MTSDAFRKIALSMPLAVEGEHMGHPDFRVPSAKGKIFASLLPDGLAAMVKVPPAEQKRLVGAGGGAFEPFTGAWGKAGCTRVTLKSAKVKDVRAAMQLAWRMAAPKGLVKEFEV